MRVSVALCTYNGVTFLNEQLSSFESQSRLPDELVVSDDASTDATMSLLRSFAASAPFPVRIFCNEETLGYSRNFTQAVLLCSGDVVAFSDQDDVWYPEKLAHLCQVLETQPDVQGVFSDGDIIDDHSMSVGRTLWESFLFDSSDQAQFASGKSVDILLSRNVVTGMTLAFRRAQSSLLEDRPNSWMHDGWLAIVLALRDGLQACPDRLVGYRVHGTQQVGTPATLTTKLSKLLSKGVRSYTQGVHAKNLDEYQRTATQFDDLHRYLRGDPGIDSSVLRKVEQKAKHAHRGALALGRPRSRRLSLLLRHATSYTHFSPNGLRGLLRDLVI